MPRRSPSCERSDKALVVLGGEQVPDASLMELSTVPIGVAAEAHLYLAQGGPANLAPAARLPVRHRAADRDRASSPPAEQPAGACCPARSPTRPAIGRGWASSSTGRSTPPGTPRTSKRWPMPSTRPAACGVPIFATSLRDAPADLLESPRHPGRPDHHRARRRRHQAGDGVAPEVTTRPGTCGRWPRWTSRSCKGCA